MNECIVVINSDCDIITISKAETNKKAITLERTKQMQNC